MPGKLDHQTLIGKAAHLGAQCANLGVGSAALGQSLQPGRLRLLPQAAAAGLQVLRCAHRKFPRLRTADKHWPDVMSKEVLWSANYPAYI